MKKKRFTNNYYINSFFWSTFAKILNALFGFVSVPLLLGVFGKAEYGLLSIATACNGYMHLMDLGMNTGAIRYFSQWKTEGKTTLIDRVARTNITFYLIISFLNVVGLLALAFFGESLFSVNHEQFLQLRTCLIILAAFSPISWVTTAFNQLLVADKKIVFTQQVNCFQVLLKVALLYCVIKFQISLSAYFLILTAIIAIAIFPYIVKCKNAKLINSILPANHWIDFKVVLYFSLSIFALSLFQATATQSRPIILSMFAVDGAEAVAEYRILEVMPQLIIMICGTFTSIFLPKTTEIYTKGIQLEINGFVNKWTSFTTIIVCILCFPFIISAEEILFAYVGRGYNHLAKWLMAWSILLILQLHSTPAYSMLMAKGKTKMLVIFTAIASVLSVIINACLCQMIPIGSTVIGYAVYMVSLVLLYYLFFYKSYLGINQLNVFKNFFIPFILAILIAIVIYHFRIETSHVRQIVDNERFTYIIAFIINAILWMIPYIASLFLLKIIDLKDFKNG